MIGLLCPRVYRPQAGPGWSLVIENMYNSQSDRDNGVTLGDTSAEQIAARAGLAAVPFERKGIYPLRQTEPPLTILLPERGLLGLDSGGFQL